MVARESSEKHLDWESVGGFKTNANVFEQTQNF